MIKEDILEAIAEDYLSVVRQGKSPPEPEYYVRKCPSLDREIRSLLHSLRSLEQFSHQETQRKVEHTKPSVRHDAPSSLGDFEIVREIGRGGMGVVYLAADRVLDRRVALKVMRIDGHKSDLRVERFEREAKLASRLHHTSIVPVFGVGRADQYLYYVMQFIDGVDLRAILNHLEKQEGQVDLTASLIGQARQWIAFDLETASASASDETKEVQSDAGDRSGDSIQDTEQVSPNPKRSFDPKGRYFESIAEIGSQVCEALHYAHLHNILHRDVKPSNLLLDRWGNVWVTDFGLAKLQEGDDLTQSGDILGTLRYMAPEQLEGGGDARSDIYSIGLTLYELLTLQPAHPGTSFRRLLEEKTLGLHAKPRALVTDIPADLETIVLKSIAADPSQRYSTAAEMQRDLERFLQDLPIVARRATWLERSVRWCRRNRAVAALLFLVAVLSLSLPIGLGLAYRQESRQRQRAEDQLQIALAGLDEVFRSFVSQEPGFESGLNSGEYADAPLRLTPESANFLQRMLVYYDRLAAAEYDSSNPQVLYESVRANRRVGDIHQSLGQFSEALDAYAQAESRLETLRSQGETVPAMDLHQIRVQRSRVLLAQNATEEARTLLQSCLTDVANIPGPTARLLECRIHLAIARSRPTVPSENPQPLHPAPPWGVQFWSFLGPEGVHGPAHRRPPAQGRQRGNRRPPPPMRDGSPKPDHARPRKPDRAADDGFLALSKSHTNQALQLLTALINAQEGQESPTTDASQLQYLKALCLRQLAGPGVMKPEDPNDQKAQAVELLKSLIQKFPKRTRYRFELSQTLRDLRARQIRQPEMRQAIQQLADARELSEQLVAEQDQVALYRINLAHIYANQAILWEGQQNMRKAEDANRLAIEAHRHVMENFPDLSPLSRRLIPGPTFALTGILRQLNRDSEALDYLKELEQELQKQISDSHAAEDFRQKARGDLAKCIRCKETYRQILSK